MKREKKLTVAVLIGIILFSIILFTTQAEPGKAKIRITCSETPGIGETAIDNSAGTVGVQPDCTATIDGSSDPTTFHAGSNIEVFIKAPQTKGDFPVTVRIIDDADSSTDYKIHGDSSNDDLTYVDAAGDDKVDFKGKKGTNTWTVFDEAGDDIYKGFNIRGPVTSFVFSDTGGDLDKIELNLPES